MLYTVPFVCVQMAWADVPLAEQARQDAPAVIAPSEAATAENLSTKSDSELTQLTAQWSQLSPSERRNLLAEVRGRMAANQQARPSMGIRVQRRYGRLVRKPDGSVVMQTRIVEMRPAHPNQGHVRIQQLRSADDMPRTRVTFGIGFEQRSKSRQEQTPSQAQQQSAPGVTVSQSQPDKAP